MRAIETFFRGLPDPRCAAWLGQAARNLPDPVAALLPRSLKSRHLPRAESALELLGVLVSAHPAFATDAVRAALGTRHRKLRPLAILLAGEEAAGLRAGNPASSEADLLSEKVREALEGRDASLRAAAASALLLAEPDGGRRTALLAAAARDERDPGTLAAILSSLQEAGGIEEIFSLSRSPSPGLRREALRAAAGLSEWPPGEADPLERLLREDLSGPGGSREDPRLAPGGAAGTLGGNPGGDPSGPGRCGPCEDPGPDLPAGRFRGPARGASRHPGDGPRRDSSGGRIGRPVRPRKLRRWPAGRIAGDPPGSGQGPGAGRGGPRRLRGGGRPSRGLPGGARAGPGLLPDLSGRRRGGLPAGGRGRSGAPRAPRRVTPRDAACPGGPPDTTGRDGRRRGGGAPAFV